MYVHSHASFVNVVIFPEVFLLLFRIKGILSLSSLRPPIAFFVTFSFIGREIHSGNALYFTFLFWLKIWLDQG